MVRAKTVAGGSSRGYSNGVHKGSKGHVINLSRNGFDGHLMPPNRQTANIVRQPITLVRTTSRDTRPTPSNILDQQHQHSAKQAGGHQQQHHSSNSASNNRDKPRQMFWCKRLENLRPMLLRTYQTPDQAVAEPLLLPTKILPTGPNISDTSASASLAAFLQHPSLDRDSTGQMYTKKILESNPGVFTEPSQPLIQNIILTDQDVLAQERRVLDARRRLEEALKHFG